MNEDICLSRIVLMSGVRPAGRTVDRRGLGRSKYGILYIWEGAVEFHFADGRLLRAQAGDLTVIPKGSRYLMRYAADGTTYVLMDLDMTLPNGEDCSFFDRVTVVANDLPERHIASIMAKLEMCSASENSSAVFRRKELAYRLFSTVFDGAQLDRTQSEYPQIRPGVVLLQQSYLENIPITQLAEVSGVSVSSFRRQFGLLYGVSPVQYRNHLRLQRARALLLEGSCTVTEAAYASGFENLGYFCRSYKKHMGETPQATRSGKA